MNSEIREKLDGVIETAISKLPELTDGSDEKSEAINELTKLCVMRNDLYKLEIEASKCKNEDSEKVKERWFKVGIAAAELVIPLMFYAVWMSRGLKFEETGTFTSSTFRGLVNRFRPTKK